MRLGFRYLILKSQLLVACENGQDLVEYCLIAALLACACVASTSGFAKLILNAFNSISSSVGADI
jgi:Flp pilus assembly pilin Flp